MDSKINSKKVSLNGRIDMKMKYIGLEVVWKKWLTHYLS